jgi:ABC-type multidrug transport system fused ATPase/permease subunit
MLNAVRASLSFMTRQERRKWILFTTLRSILSVFDLIGILAIGFIATSTAVFLTSGSDPNRVIQFAGIDIPAVNALTLPWLISGVVALFLAKALFSIILTKQAAYLIAHVEARAAKTIAEISFGADLGAARMKSREEVTFAIQAGSPAAFGTIINAFSSMVTEATLFLIICLGFMFVDLISTLAAILYFALVALAIEYFVGSLTARAGKTQGESSVRANTAISDLIAVFRELHVLGKKDLVIEKIYQFRTQSANSSARIFFLSGMPRYIIEASLLLGLALFIFFQALSGDIVKSAATLGVFLSGGFRLTAALLPLQNSLIVIRSNISQAETAHEILARGTANVCKEYTDLTQDGSSANNSSPIGLEFKGVTFSYPDSDTPAIRNMNFSIEAGSQVALMGPSGAGKSTVADLLCQVQRPTSGVILRTDSESPPNGDRVFGRVSYVPQRPGLVSGSILDNVALAVNSEDVNREQALSALKLANLGELIENLPQGLDTHLGKLQDGLSGGQIQRLGLARALYTKPGLLIMDEATSALDAESESEIQRALDNMRGKVTVVLIAHRLNTIQHADKVVLIDGGQVKDSGTFKQLVSRNPSVEKAVDLMRVEKT